MNTQLHLRIIEKRALSQHVPLYTLFFVEKAGVCLNTNFDWLKNQILEEPSPKICRNIFSFLYN